MVSDKPISFRVSEDVKMALRRLVTMPTSGAHDMSDALRHWVCERILLEAAIELMRIRGFDHAFQHILNGTHASTSD